MKRKTEAINFEITEDGDIRISQDYGLQDEQAVFVSRDQIPQLVGWLREAEAELEQREASNQPLQ